MRIKPKSNTNVVAFRCPEATVRDLHALALRNDKTLSRLVAELVVAAASDQRARERHLEHVG